MVATSPLKAQKPSKVVKPKKSTKRLTVTTKNHRFESFSERIAKLKIDPIRRRRNAEEDQEELLQHTGTYLGRSLEEWKDLNLSQTFTRFVQECSPLCDSLPVVLHNEEKIAGLLIGYIEKGDALAMQPLLNLLSHFAHDLDARFEKHFQRAVAIVTAIAAKHQDLGVVEWSFTCLAWLFKYLSRLLTPDLRPLYDLMAPYLGKEAQKPFIIRFTAESLSFLVRKAAATYDRDPASLDLIVRHMLGDCSRSANSPSQDLHQQGLMTLFTEAIKGIQNGLHSSGVAVLQSLLKSTDACIDLNTEVASRIIQGTLTSLVHHTTADTFRVIQQVIIHHATNTTGAERLSLATMNSQIIFTIASVRKGTRISDWSGLIAPMKTYARIGQESVEYDDETRISILSALAVILQNATIDQVLPALNLFEMIQIGVWSSYFIRFCDIFTRLGHERFENFLLPHCQQFVLQQWHTNEDEIYNFLQRLRQDGLTLQLDCSVSMQDAMVQRIVQLSSSMDCDPSFEQIVSANLAVAALSQIKLEVEARRRLNTELLLFVRRALKAENNGTHELDNFALGACFAAMLETTDEPASLSDLWPLLCSASRQFTPLSKFWSNSLRYLEICPPSSEKLHGPHSAIMKSSLLQCLTLPSHDVRSFALDIIQTMYRIGNQEVPSVLSTAACIESTPVSLESSRTISMNIRKLASEHNTRLDLLMQKAIPTYCYGLLHFKLAQAWEDSIDALAEMSKTAVGEEVISSLSQAWLEGGSAETKPMEPQKPLSLDSSGFQTFSDFECSNRAKVSAICAEVFQDASSRCSSAEFFFRSAHTIVPPVSSVTRDKALRVLSKIPNIAEKRSRMLVPVLLRWASSADSESDLDEEISCRWARKDQKSMLAIFSQFVNPKVLFKATEVYNALLNLCANGDIEIQRSALKAIFSWKDVAVNKYDEHLNNLLDEARFRDEISVFLQGGGEDGMTLQNVDHPKLMPVLLRLLYGRAVAGGQYGQSSRRKAIFVALSRFGVDVLGNFVDIALGSVGTLRILNGTGLSELSEQSLLSLRIPMRQQLGMLNMIHDLLKSLGLALEPFVLKLLDAVLICTVKASRQLESIATEDEPQDGSLLRSVRQVGVQCLAQIFSVMSEADFEQRPKVILAELIFPRLENFASENAQSVSGLLRLLGTWSSLERLARYLAESEGLLDKIAELLRSPAAKEEVRLFILRDLLDNILQHKTAGLVTEVHTRAFIKSVGEVVKQQPSKELLDACVTSFTHLADTISQCAEAEDVVALCTGLLTKPNRAVSAATKTDLLKTVLPLVENFEISTSTVLYKAICGLFSRLHNQASRVLLSQVFLQICKTDPENLEGAQICEGLNALGIRLDEPDHERREQSFSKIYERYPQITIMQWEPIIHNCLFYIRDADDLVNRSSASQALDRFIRAASGGGDSYKPLIASVLIPGIEHGMRESVELVRAEYLRLLGSVTERFSDWSLFSDMKGLVASGDEEASFFTNILHIQQHRRLRALRRLADEAAQLSSNNVTNVFVPMLEHFIFDQAEGDAGRALADQTIQTIGALGQALNWSAFRATFRRYTNLLSSKEDLEKAVLRILGGLVDALTNKTSSELDMSRTDIIVRDFLPPLVDYIHRKDESTVDRRMPVAVTIAKLLMLLPESQRSARLAPVLTDVCHVLRSRSQEARDQTRKALAAILSIISPAFLGFIVKELRSALQRGYQLHVLSYTVHSLLVHSMERMQPGDLDHCLPELIAVIMDDVFGIAGQEKDEEEYKSAMKEVKSSKSFDTMELLAKVTPIPRLGQLVRPLRSLLLERLDAKTNKKIDNLLTRLGKGIDMNPAADSRDMLVLCHEIIRQLYTEHDSATSVKKPTVRKTNEYLIKMEAADKSKGKSTTTSQTFKLASFAFNLLRKVIRRHEDLMTTTNLVGFLPIAGDALVQGQEEVQISAVRLLSTVMKLPLLELDSNASVYVKEAVRLIKASPDVTADSAKAALELLTSILREKRSATVKEKDIAVVLKLLKGSIDEPDRQGIIYKFLRAVLGRKIMATEVYEIMDEVGVVVVTNPDRNVRESARSAYLQFVLEYPQGKDRWNKQAAFLIENLRYEYPAGRQSVMELMHQLFSKLGDGVLAQIAFTAFIALVPVHVSDSDQACKQMAGILIEKLFERSNDVQLQNFLSIMEQWLQNELNPTIQVAALQCWSVLIRTKAPPTKAIAILRDKLVTILDTNGSILDSRLSLNALQTLETLVKVVPEVAFDKASAGVWKNFISNVNLPQADAKQAAANLLGDFLSDFASANSKTAAGLSHVPLQGSGGLKLGADDMYQMCHIGLRILQDSREEASEWFLAQTIRNLVFIGRCFAANQLSWKATKTSLSVGDEEHEIDTGSTQSPSAICYLFGRLSYIVRQETQSVASRTAAIQCQAALINHVSEIPELQSIIRPLYTLTDPSIPQPPGEAQKTLVYKARELLESLQKKVSSEAYVAALGAVRSEAKSRREDRRQKRRVDAISAPEKWAREKRKKHDIKKSKVKEKASEARGRRRGW